MKALYFTILTTNLIWTRPSLQSTQSNQTELEDGYIKHFGNTGETQFWDMARIWYLEHREPRLKRFCTEAHKQSGYGFGGANITNLSPRELIYQNPGAANNTNLRPRTLIFMNPEYKSRTVDLAVYGLNGITDFWRDRYYFWLWRDDYWYLTAGERDDCVYYVRHANKSAHAFKLVKHVCGIFVNLTYEYAHAYY